MNRLQYESSPYLLQHRHNPVDWYAWKPEAFERARRENKPILVSIGYSTCHWCHVMERESFENSDIAAVMNERFVNIKVDREERPDVDAIYMEACQILTGGGGWPLNCFLTPEGKPFYAGTYYPPRPAHNRPSWLQLLQHMANAWETQRNTVYEQADKLMEYIRNNDNVLLHERPSVASLDPALQSVSAVANAGAPGGALENVFYRMRERFDRVEGGFGGAPKFPSTMALQFLLNYYQANRQQGEALEHALLSLDKMILGGLYDQLGGGFSRYSTDREWLAPHFEKMLYDNALLLTVLADAVRLLASDADLRVAHEERLQLYRDTIRETLDYLFREMAHPEGAFFAAQDADSEGVEGKYYVWEKAEIDAVLGADADLFNAFYDVSESGNWEHHNILRRLSGLIEFAAQQNRTPDAVREELSRCRERLLAVRNRRVPPGLDDKVLLGWNALMVSALAAVAATGEERSLTAAVRCMDFLLEHFQGPEQTLLHTWKDGWAQYPALLDDYAFLIAALIDLYQMEFDFRYLELAERYTEQVLRAFTDDATGLFYFSAEGQEDLVLRKKDLYDNATPSGNSTMVTNLQRLGILLDRPDWRERAETMLERLVPTLEKYPLSFERWALALLHAAEGIHEIAVVGDNAREKVRRLNALYLPNKVLAASQVETQAIPLLAGKTGGKDALIYVCRNFTCRQPVTEPEALKSLVRRV